MQSYLIKKTLSQCAATESGSMVFPAGVRRPVAFVYPNFYRIGMSNLGLHILYKIINDRCDCACERYFLPEQELLSEYKRSKTSLLSIETQRALADNEVVFVMLSFEMDYENLLTVLDLGNIKLRAKTRGGKEPLVIVGGPCATFNPLPLSGVADAFVIGEGEETVNKILDEVTENRQITLQKLSKIPGVYVPSVKNKVKRQWVKEIDKYPHTSAIITSQTEFANMYIVEVARGCGRHCRFCMAGYCFRKPRPRALQNILQDIENRPVGMERIGLMGAAVSDHPQIKEIVAYLKEKKIKFSVASLRADTLDKEMCDALGNSGQKTLTVAPEAGSVKLRRAINKGITEEHIFQALGLAAQSGMHSIKLYFMIGLPGEDDSDIQAILQMVQQVRRMMDKIGYKGDLVLSVNAFVPKPFTPYQWDGMEDVKILRHRFKMLTDGLRSETKIKLITESLKETVVQAALARGDEKMGEYLLAAHESGQSLKTFMQSKGINLAEMAQRELNVTDILPWEFIDMGVSKDYLLQEREKAKQGEFTAKCFDGCHRCGNC